ncbi:MAG TPA: hypothetical protein VMD31_02195 [Opitutaceae bacterium]|nr:hypothetical protein [Opitutaceae bacterium]
MMLRTPIFSTLLGGRRPRLAAHFPPGFGRAPGARNVDAAALPAPARPASAPARLRLTDELPGKPGFQFRGIL